MNRKLLCALSCVIVLAAVIGVRWFVPGPASPGVDEKSGRASGRPVAKSSLAETRTLPWNDDASPFDEIAPFDERDNAVRAASYEESLSDDDAAPGSYQAAEVTLTDRGSGDEKYLLQYKFEKGETVRWEVEHRAQVRSTVQGVTQQADTLSNSIKVWSVTDVAGDGRATFVYSVESVDMRQQFEGKQEIHYNSLTDAVAPPGFDDVAKSVGIELSVMTLDRAGNVVEREERRPDKAGTAPPQEMITPPLPAEEISVGARWQIPADIKVTLTGGESKRISAQQKFTFEDVSDGVATIRIETVVLTPVRDPAIEAQLVQSKANGVIRFDIAAGRLASQRSDVDEHVVGFQGEGSSMHYVMRFSEKLLPAGAKTARKRAPAGP
ncbi:MAG TPA: hypothetical protein VGX78_02995, partial [Pirellulales bacterium]|nr:hypothetical protein [Pirellulales bacterium]